MRDQNAPYVKRAYTERLIVKLDNVARETLVIDREGEKEKGVRRRQRVRRKENLSKLMSA